MTGSEDVGLLATAAGVPCGYWLLGGADPAVFEGATDFEEIALRTAALPSNQIVPAAVRAGHRTHAHPRRQRAGGRSPHVVAERRGPVTPGLGTRRPSSTSRHGTR